MVKIKSLGGLASMDSSHILNIRTGQQETPPAGQYPTFKAEYTPAENEIIIQTGESCGKPSTPFIYCRPEDKENVLNYLGAK